MAIKTLKSSFRAEKNMVELIKEAKFMFHVGNHEHILKLHYNSWNLYNDVDNGRLFGQKTKRFFENLF